MSLHLIRTIARYEMRTLLRSWFFRIFSGLAIVGLGIFNIALNVEASGAPWIYKGLEASIPYANLIILNLGQAIVAVFLASEFLKQDKKNDTVEVIYARSMTNGEYILGKTLGILSVFLVLNIIVLLIGTGFSFLNNVAARNVLPYFMYPVLISLPTLIFILGLSFFTMVMVRNQAVTFILLLGYISLTVFYLSRKLFHLFDYIAYHVPMMYSSISGFSDFREILYHRLIYFLLGTGLIFLTVFRLQRLPQPPNKAFIPLVTGILFLLAGGFFVYQYLDLKYAARDFRSEILELNHRYYQLPQGTLRECNLELEHQGDRISVIAGLVIENLDTVKIDTLVLSLNPALEIKQVTVNHDQKPCTRKKHLILIKMPLLPGEKSVLSIRYSGKIDERMCFTDNPGLIDEENFYAEVFTLKKRYAFLGKNYVCLTSESFWYPQCWTGYTPERPMYFKSDQVKFTLRVKTSEGLIPVSQGRVQKIKSTYTFSPEYPLPKLSLVIGNYKKSSISVDSVEYSIFTLNGHDYYADLFKGFSDTVPSIIRDIKNEYEAGLGFTYPYKRFSLVEVPVHFALDKHEYSYTSDAVQPEMILSTEKGVAYSSSDFRNRKYRIEREMKRNNEELLPEEIQTRMFRQFIHNNFLTRENENYIFGTDWRTFTIFPEYYTFPTRMNPERWPVLAVALEAYMNERTIKKGTNAQWYEGMSREEKINQEINGRSLKDVLTYGIEAGKNEDNPLQIRDVMLMKGNDLFNLLRAKYGEKEVDTLLTEFVHSHPFEVFSFGSLNDVFRKKLNVDLNQVVDQWYHEKLLPGYMVGEITSYKIIQGETTKYQVLFSVTNSEEVDGLITVNVEEKNPNRQNNWWEDNFHTDVSRMIYIPARSSQEIGLVLNTEPARLSVVTHVSKNLPNNLIYNFSGFTENRKVASFDGIRDIPFIDGKNTSEIIVDNEDKGFSCQQALNQAFLKSKINRNKQNRYKYSRLQSWNPEREWKAVLRSEFYGESIHSAYYTRSGSGERKAVWKTLLPESGSYEVYFYLNTINAGWRRNNRASDYNLTIYHDGGSEKVHQTTEGAENGWTYLGTFQISDTAKVELSNKSNGDMVIADAVKWVRAK